MYYILPFFLFVNVVVTNFFYTTSLSSIESAIDSVSKNTLSQCIIKLNNEVKSIDDLQINQEEFEDLFLKQFQSNLSYYASDVEVSFAYYNVLTKQECNNENITCNGVQIRIVTNVIPMIKPLEKYLRYEVKDNQIP